MNQGKLEMVKQEMARMNINILGIKKNFFLGISELKWTGMGEFNSDDYYICPLPCSCLENPRDGGA